MTVATVDPETFDMVFVAERHRLLDDDIGARQIRRANENAQDGEQPGEKKDRAEDCHLRDSVGARVKDLSHPRSTLASGSLFRRVLRSFLIVCLRYVRKV